MQAALFDFAVEHPTAALELVCGTLIGLVEYHMEKQGEDSTKAILIECGRDITIGELKE